MKLAKIGDKITALGITATIGEILSQSHWFGIFAQKDYWDIEFVDTNGKYRHWKSIDDGGELIPC